MYLQSWDSLIVLILVDSAIFSSLITLKVIVDQGLTESCLLLVLYVMFYWNITMLNGLCIIDFFFLTIRTVK